MIYAKEQVRLDVPVEEAWKRLSDLQWLVTVNMFHHRARFEGKQRSGAGTRITVYHRLFGGPPWARYVRVTHWEEPVRIGWVETDSINLRHFFPHSQQFTLRPLGPGATLLTDEVRGSLNLPLVERLADRLAQNSLVKRAVRKECLRLKRDIENANAGYVAP